MIRTLSYDDRRLRNISGDPLISTIIESAARLCGFGLIYDFWGVFPGRFSRHPQGFILRKGSAMWATAIDPEAAPEMVNFIRFHQSGWVELDPLLASFWGTPGEELFVMQYPPERDIPLLPVTVREGTPTAVADCNLGAGGILPRQYEVSVVNLHLAERRRVGCSVTHWEEETAVSAAAVCDSGSRYGEISYVATLPDYEGRGFGRAMVYRAAEALREREKIPLIACEPHRLSFYEELGFETIGKSYLMVEEPSV